MFREYFPSATCLFRENVDRQAFIKEPKFSFIFLKLTWCYFYFKNKQTDGTTLSNSKLIEGSKIHLFVKKPEEAVKKSALDIALNNALKNHLTKEEIERVITAFNKELQLAFEKNYSLDDIERLAINLLR